jgi:hypothetical protein
MWAEEDGALDESERLIASGKVRIDEVPDLDLAVIDVPDDAPTSGGHRFASQHVAGLHPMAVHNATNCLAVLSVRGQAFEFAYRYESWVQYRTRRPRPRADLGPLAEELTGAEARGGRWVYEGAGGLTPRLYLAGTEESSLPPARVRAMLEAHLRSAPPAWDPYNEAGSAGRHAVLVRPARP